MLARRLSSIIEHGGRKYHVEVSFDTILRAFELQRDKTFDEYERVSLTLELLIGRRARRLKDNLKVELFNKIFDSMILIKARSTGRDIKTVDFTQDAPLIYAAFRQAYNIDLQMEQGRLDWREFIALFQGLPSDTRISEIMSIRGKDLPPMNEHNRAQIAELQKAKAFYALEYDAEDAQNNFQKGIDKLANTLIHKAKAAQGKAAQQPVKLVVKK